MEYEFLPTPNKKITTARVFRYGDKLFCEEWDFQYDPQKHIFRPYTYRAMKRDKPRVKFEQVECFTTTGDSRSNTLSDMPVCPDEVRVASFARWTNTITQIGFSDGR